MVARSVRSYLLLELPCAVPQLLYPMDAEDQSNVALLIYIEIHVPSDQWSSISIQKGFCCLERVYVSS